MKRTLVIVFAIVALLVTSSVAWAAPGNLILQVPDWNQPNNYGPPPAMNSYPMWCSPTAGANLMGYWEDVMGCTGLTDRQAFGASPVYPGTVATWQQGLWHDGTVEMGWHMDTGTWQTAPRPFPPVMGMTTLASILPGLLSYATSGWTDDSFGPNPGTGIVKVAYPNTTGFTDAKGFVGFGQMWATYCAEIDAARPVEVSFEHWVDPTQFLGTMTIDGFPQLAETYPWDTSVDPHSVVGVGYIDITPGYQGGADEWFVCQDNWPGPGMGGGGTGQYVAVPLDSMWQQNDYITAVPEPSTFVLAAIGLLGLLGVARRRRR